VRVRLLAAGLGLLVCLVVPALVGAAPASKPRRAAGFTATIAYVVDGDTLRIREADGNLAYVRLLGIDSPESVKPDTPVECGGKQASESMEELAPEGAKVRLAFDGEREDNYGRTLAHAYVNGRQLELAQLRRGWAEIYRYHDRTFRGLARYYALEEQAEAARRGVWGQCGGDFHSARG
jgi:micrococcal nuclease